MADKDATPSREVANFVAERAPELDPAEVSAFMQEHAKPGDAPGTHLEWAVRVMRERSEGEFGEGLPVDRVVGEMRRLSDND